MAVPIFYSLLEVSSTLLNYRIISHDITKYRTTFVSPDTITFSTIHSFKGLENSYIILIDINRLDNDEFKSFLYVGMSRARVGLCLLLAEQSKKDYDTLLKKRLG